MSKVTGDQYVRVWAIKEPTQNTAPRSALGGGAPALWTCEPHIPWGQLSIQGLHRTANFFLANIIFIMSLSFSVELRKKRYGGNKEEIWLPIFSPPPIPMGHFSKKRKKSLNKPPKAYFNQISVLALVHCKAEDSSRSAASQRQVRVEGARGSLQDVNLYGN